MKETITCHPELDSGSHEILNQHFDMLRVTVHDDKIYSKF